MTTIDILSISDVNIPARGWVSGKRIHIPLNTKYKIQRLSFIFKSPILIPKESDLAFQFFSKTPKLMKPDILKGDQGYPEIQVENVDGTTFRFKRGNFKDFFHFKDAGLKQNVKLPYNAFLYNQDLKKNLNSTDDFFSIKIKKISFDFLANENEEITLEMDNPRFEVSKTENLISIFNLLNVEKINKSGIYPTFLSESSFISLALSKNEICSTIYSKKLTLKWWVKAYNKIHQRGTIEISEEKSYLQLPLLTHGENNLTLEIHYQDKVIAFSELPIVKVYQRSKKACKTLGLSDTANSLQGLNLTGGTYRRLVVDLRSIQKTAKGYKFSLNNDFLSLLTGSKKTKIIIAFKCMPKWLSSSSKPDYHRYGPKDLSEYKLLIKWLINALQSANVWAIEPWNEGNVIHEWNDTLEMLQKIQKVTWSAAKEVPGCKIKILSPSSTSWDFEYFTKLMDAGVYNYCDGLAMHAYTYSPEKHNQLFSRLELFLKSGKRNLTAYITEVGFRNPAFSHEEQSLYLSLFTLQAFFRPCIQALIWFRYQNFNPESMSHYNQNASGGYAMVGYNENYCRPMIAAYRFLDNYLSKIQAITIHEEEDIIFEADYKGKNIFISCSYNKIHESILKRQPLEETVFLDMYGNIISQNNLSDHTLIFTSLNF